MKEKIAQVIAVNKVFTWEGLTDENKQYYLRIADRVLELLQGYHKHLASGKVSRIE